jgi:Spy/CpxP family protein refolding chaperone
MKRNLILSLLACGASLVLCPGVNAQDATPTPAAATSGADTGAGGHHHGDMMARLTSELSLTDDQQAKIKPLLDTFHSTMQANRADTTLTQQEKMAKNKEARESLNTQINAILTPDQQTKFAAMQAKMHGHHHGEDSQTAATPTPAQ